MSDRGKDRLVLVTGASGYVGGRLVPVLEERGERVRRLMIPVPFLSLVFPVCGWGW